MKHLKFAVVMLIMLVPFVLTLAGETATYEWVDDAGVVHFTDDKGTIPAKYLKKVKELNSGSDEYVKPPAAPAPQSTPPEASSPRDSKVMIYGGYSERSWRSRFASLRGEIQSLEKALPSMKEELGKLSRKRVVYGRASDRVAREKLFQEIGRTENRIKVLQEELKILDNEASQADVPPEWRQSEVNQ